MNAYSQDDEESMFDNVESIVDYPLDTYGSPENMNSQRLARARSKTQKKIELEDE